MASSAPVRRPIRVAIRTLQSLLLATAASSATAQSTLLRQADIELLDGFPVHRLAIGDLDQDGLADVVALTLNTLPTPFTRDKIVVQRQLPPMSGSSTPRYATVAALDADAPQGLALVDLDGDADLDLAVAQDLAQHALAVWLNTGGAQGGSPGNFVRAGAVGALSADFNADDRADVLIYGSECWLWLQRGAGLSPPFQGVQIPECAGAKVFAAVAQVVEGPRRVALAIGGSSASYWFRQIELSPTGVPQFQAEPLGGGNDGLVRATQLIDADNDGDRDLISARLGAASVVFRRKRRLDARGRQPGRRRWPEVDHRRHAGTARRSLGALRGARQPAPAAGDR